MDNLSNRRPMDNACQALARAAYRLLQRRLAERQQRLARAKADAEAAMATEEWSVNEILAREG